MTIKAMALTLPDRAQERRSSRRLNAARRGRPRRRLPRKAFLALALIPFPALVPRPAVCQAQPQIQTQPQTHPHKEHKRDYKREIEAVEEQWRTAQLTSDFATMDKLMAEDYFGISVAGQLNNKMQQLDRLKTRSLVITKLDVSDMKIKLVGRVAIVTSLAEIEGMNEGEALKGKYRYTRVYKRYPDGSWKITNFEVTRVPGAG